MNHENRRLIEQVYAFETSHEIEKVLALLAEDATYEDVPLGVMARGHAEISNLLETMYAAMPDFAIRPVSIVTDGDSGSAEWIQSGTFRGDFGDLKATGTGKPFSVRGALIVRFANGRISRWTDYWSKSTFKEQVGLERTG